MDTRAYAQLDIMALIAQQVRLGKLVLSFFSFMH
jgi:hypothetical protein